MRDARGGLGGGDSEFAPLISSAKIDVAGQPVTRYFTQFKPPVGSVGGWNADAAVQVGGTCLDIGYFAYSRSVAESLLPTFDLMVASIRPA